MIKRSLFVLAVSLFLAGGELFAQTPSNKDARIMNYQILNTVESYARTSTLYKESYVRDFLDLFEERTKQSVYNDMMNSKSYQSMISADEYVKQYTPDGDVVLDTDVSSLKFIGPFEFRDGKWHRKVTIQKTVKIIDSRYYSDGAGGVLYDSQQLYPKEPYFDLEIDMVYDAEKSKAFIYAIDIALSKPTTPIDAEKYSVILKSGTKYDSQVMSANNKLSFNDFDEAFAAYNDYSLKDEDVRITPTEVATCDFYNVLQLKYTPKHLRARARVGFAPFGAYNIATASDGLNTSSKGFEFCIDLGYTFSAGKAKMGPFIGVGISSSSIAMSMDDFAYAYPGKISDHNRKLYVRNYSITEATECLALKDLLIPFYWSAEHKLSDYLKLTWDLGVKFYIPMKTTLGPYKVEGSTFGVYSDGTKVTDSVEDALGTIDRSFSSFMVPVDYSRGKYDLSAFANLGLEVKIYGDLSAVAAVGYEHGLTWIYQSNNDVYFDSKEGIYPLVYSTQNKEDVAVRSFIGCISYKRQAFWMSLGLKYKF